MITKFPYFNLLKDEKLRSEIQLNMYIMSIQGNYKCVISEQLSFTYRLKLYVLFMNGKNEAVL